ncbi:hypothetical protein PRZ48_001719 [Zasmidium cellare]|uniref:Uncharacterized protein n=1 Tax=Zasmidium cellare TaxID=395010 RepID=A0ABR0F210_ZASCE|nr:hypothetical protein PRZ48_001719 [Zasmidium cellare]
MNIRDFWGKLDPIAIVGIIIFIAMLILAIMLLTITQRLAAREYINAYEEHSEALASQRDILRQRRQIQTEEILRKPERDSVASSAGRSSIPNARASRQSFVDPYTVPPRKPVPNRRSVVTFELDHMNDRVSSSTSPAPGPSRAIHQPTRQHRSRQHRPRQHPPLFFQRPGYQPVPIFDLVGDATSPGTK